MRVCRWLGVLSLLILTNGLQAQEVQPFRQLGEGDSLRADSSVQDKVQTQTQIIRSEAFIRHKQLEFSQIYEISAAQHWDSLDIYPGFALSLGQIGKPYLLLLDGVPDYLYSKSQWMNPVTRRYNMYVYDPSTQALYFDTRTPYVRIDYTLGDKNLQIAEITISRNISSLWNITGQISSPKSAGAYNQFRTDQIRLYLNNYFHSRDRKYQLFVSTHLSELNNNQNGGIPRDSTGEYEVIDGIIQENPAIFADVFQKNILRTNLEDAKHLLTSKGIYLDQYLVFDEVAGAARGKHLLSFRNVLQYTYTDRLYSDKGIATDRLGANLIPVYPTLAADSNYLSERYEIRQLSGKIEAGYTYRGPIRIHAEGGLGYERLSWNQDGNLLVQDIFSQRVAGQISWDYLQLGASFKQNISTVFAPEQMLQLRLRIEPAKRKPAFLPLKDLVPDSALSEEPTKKITRDIPPFSILFAYQLNNLNPSLYQAHFIPGPGNTYKSNSGLSNQTLSHLSLGVIWQNPARYGKTDTLLGNYYKVRGFFTTVDRFIHYDDSLRILQAAPGETLARLGLEFGTRIRIVPKFYFEGLLTWQAGSTELQGWLKRYAQNVPSFYGKASIYYDTRRVKFGRLRIGLDAYFNTAYTGMTPDLISGEFFPANYQVGGYVRADAYVSIEVWLATVTLKFTHFNEQLFQAGYYRTPFYPMLERTFSLGVNWTFFD